MHSSIIIKRSCYNNIHIYVNYIALCLRRPILHRRNGQRVTIILTHSYDTQSKGGFIYIQTIN